jgi:MFS transporter
VGLALPLLALGILPALLVLWVRLGVKESPRFERVTTAMLREGLKKRLDIWSPVRQYPREMLTATLLYFFYLFTWIGWSTWMPQFLANEKHLGFQTTASYLSVWMFRAIFAYYLCGWLSDLFGRRYVIPGFVLPASILLVVLGHLNTREACSGWDWFLNFPITGSFGAGLGYNTELFPPQIRGTAVGAAFTFGSALGRVLLCHRRLDCDVPLDRGSASTSCPIVLPARADVPVCGAGDDAQGAR